MRITCLVAAALLACESGLTAPDLATPVEGAWRSNRELTLAELRTSRDLTAEQWQALSDPTLFGHMIHIYRGNTAVTVFDGECSPPSSFEILKVEPAALTMRYFDSFFDESRTVTLSVEGDRLHVPIGSLEGNARETFTRIAVDELVRLHPCTRSFIEG